MYLKKDKGIVEQVGSLQKSTVSNTDRSDILVGQRFKNGIFAGGRKGKSRTTRTQLLTLSFLKVGDNLYEEVIIPKLAMYEVLKKGDEIGVVFLKDGQKLLAVNNFTLDIQIKDGSTASSNEWTICIGLIITVLGLVFVPPSNGNSQIVAILIGLILFFFGFIRKRKWLAALKYIGWDGFKTKVKKELLVKKDTPTRTITTVAYKSVEIIYNDKKVYSVITDRTFGKQELKDLHSDSQFLSNPQFRLYQHTDNWYIEHCKTATNQTIINGVQLESPLLIADGMIITVGNSKKGIQKLPLTLRGIY
jgi:hypothetical protein